MMDMTGNTDHCTRDFDPIHAAEVRLGVPLDGKIRTWSHDGVDRTWQIDDVGDLPRMMGTGALAVAPVRDGHYQETALLDGANDVLCVPAVTPISHLGGRLQTHDHYQLRPVTIELIDDDETFRLWAEFEKVLIAAIRHSFDRGEVVVVAGAGDSDRAVTFGAVHRGFADSAVVSAAPAPIANLWPEPEPDALDRTSIISPNCGDTHFESATLATVALESWGVQPYDAQITYVSPVEALIETSPWPAGDVA